MFEVDFSQATGGALAPGNYLGIVTGIDKHTSETTDKVSVSFKVNIDGKTHNTRRYFLGGKDNNFFLKEAFGKLGVEVKGKVDIDSLSLKGIKAEFSVKNREYNGKQYTELEAVKTVGKASEAELLQLDGAPF